MFFFENWQFSSAQEQARKLRPEMGALSYVFVHRHASASKKDVMKVASFFLLHYISHTKMEIHLNPTDCYQTCPPFLAELLVVE